MFNKRARKHISLRNTYECAQLYLHIGMNPKHMVLQTNIRVGKYEMRIFF